MGTFCFDLSLQKIFRHLTKSVIFSFAIEIFHCLFVLFILASRKHLEILARNFCKSVIENLQQKHILQNIVFSILKKRKHSALARELFDFFSSATFCQLQLEELLESLKVSHIW